MSKRVEANAVGISFAILSVINYMKQNPIVKYIKTGALILTALISAFSGQWYIVGNSWKDEAIDNGFAKYDEHLRFVWKTKEEVAEEYMFLKTIEEFKAAKKDAKTDGEKSEKEQGFKLSPRSDLGW